jgi:antitoxin CptB|tara:strand:+ start:183 stop:443 length:261 start_codon:yes stop_codon:yes gene_type:complete
MDSNKQNLINKILYRAQYRGTKEMDIFVSKFVNSIIDNLDYKELVSLDRLINFDDETLVNLSLGKNSKDFEDKIILEKLIEFKNKY